MTKKKKKQKKTQKKTSKKKQNNTVTDQEFLDVLDNISKRLCYKFKFAYHDINDMKQQAAIFALEGLKKYDGKRPLENFLWTHVRNRLFNFKRNNYQRPDKPCFNCPLFDKLYSCSDNQCKEYKNKLDCESYAAWSKRNESKKNIIQPLYIEDNNVNETNQGLLENIQNKEILDFLDKHIQCDHRESYLKLKHGIKVPKLQLDKLKQHISDLLRSDEWHQKDSHENEDN